MSRILVVDDDNNIRENITEILEMNEYVCLQASNGKEAVEIMENNEIDLVVSDIKMPFMDGIEFFKYLRSKNNHKDKPFIFITAKVEDELAVRNLDLGAVCYFNKPFRAMELLSKIEELLN